VTQPARPAWSARSADGARQRGAAALEYVGAVVVVAILLGAVGAALTPMGRQITAGVTRAVCTILSLPVCPALAGTGATPLARATSGRYVALGDSFSSGEGADNYLPGTNVDRRSIVWPFDNAGKAHNRCHRSANAYSQILGSQNAFQAGTTFAACSGARLDDLTKANEDNTGEPPQVSYLGQDVSLVTMTMSGNDLGFGAVLQDCVLNGQRGVGFLDTCQEKHQKRIDALLPQLQQKLVATYREIAAAAPNARVVIIGYPPLFDPDAGDSYRNLLYAEDQAWMNKEAAALDATLRSAAEQAGVEFVDVTALFAHHGIGSAQPWFNDLEFGGPGLSPVDPGSFHPNGAGQAAIAEAVQQQLESPRTP
jgi:lysophospholipase L1-like esterase